MRSHLRSEALRSYPVFPINNRDPHDRPLVFAPAEDDNGVPRHCSELQTGSVDGSPLSGCRRILHPHHLGTGGNVFIGEDLVVQGVVND